MITEKTRKRDFVNNLSTMLAKDPQDRAVFYALIELKTHRMIRSLAGRKP